MVNGRLTEESNAVSSLNGARIQYMRAVAVPVASTGASKSVAKKHLFAKEACNS